MKINIFITSSLGGKFSVTSTSTADLCPKIGGLSLTSFTNTCFVILSSTLFVNDNFMTLSFNDSRSTLVFDLSIPAEKVKYGFDSSLKK